MRSWAEHTTGRDTDTLNSYYPNQEGKAKANSCPLPILTESHSGRKQLEMGTECHGWRTECHGWRREGIWDHSITKVCQAAQRLHLTRKRWTGRRGETRVKYEIKTLKEGKGKLQGAHLTNIGKEKIVSALGTPLATDP